jgi:hypothetical protein
MAFAIRRRALAAAFRSGGGCGALRGERRVSAYEEAPGFRLGPRCGALRPHTRAYNAPAMEATVLCAQMVGWARQRWRGGHRSEAVSVLEHGADLIQKLPQVRALSSVP